MLFDFPMHYTNTPSLTQKAFLEDELPIIEQAILGTYTVSHANFLNTSVSYTPSIKRKMIPAPDTLKKAMFRVSSKGIIKALK